MSIDRLSEAPAPCGQPNLRSSTVSAPDATMAYVPHMLLPPNPNPNHKPAGPFIDILTMPESESVNSVSTRFCELSITPPEK
mmetsp:Transcript_23/g.37  ORF Transcript_23/g.37 Transcript_23/m.37 type:complete len:82 (+) Transcript_23:1385-1630(+)